MDYYKLMYDYEDSKRKIFAKNIKLNGFNRYDFEKGIKLKINENELEFEIDINEDNCFLETDYFCNDLSLLIVSEKTKKYLVKLKKKDFNL